MKKLWVLSLLLVGCASLDRGCSSWSAESFGADWIIIQQRMTDGTAYNCWILENASVTNEASSDGIYWKDTSSGHLVHIAGQYSRVQVVNKQYKTAAQLLGINADRCQGGVYPTPEKEE